MISSTRFYKTNLFFTFSKRRQIFLPVVGPNGAGGGLPSGCSFGPNVVDNIPGVGGG